jgi:hypothetical protein
MTYASSKTQTTDQAGISSHTLQKQSNNMITGEGKSKENKVAVGFDMRLLPGSLLMDKWVGNTG